LIHGLSLAYDPSFLPGLSLFVDRVCLVPWSWENLKYILPVADNTIEDQKASLGMSWIFPQVGLEIYGEFGIDDYVYGGAIGYLRHPFHTTVYMFGLKKMVIAMPTKQIYGEIIFEANWMEMTQTFYYHGNLVKYSFYRHHQILQGYTNGGQWLGVAGSPAGNSQILNFVLYYPRGVSKLLIGRNNPDTNYIITHGGHDNNYWANFDIGIETTYYVLPSLSLTGGFIYNLIIDEHYQKTADRDDILKNNFSLQMAIKWTI
jgi:hypothetical protein